ncbi:MAG: glycosyltransferase family 1 protein [Chitinophagaceae bacterium]|nr:MAG: glycosyltransferase family 1 protein [Chitinophagaceae bacterium]
MDIICYSHLRWNFVYQRPQHLLSRFTSMYRVFFVEEPLYDSEHPFIHKQHSGNNLIVLTPHLPHSISPEQGILAQKELLQDLVAEEEIVDHIAWYYTPMALDLASALPVPQLIIYDCMDELSAFQNAPPALIQNEARLMKLADLVFTGGNSLYNAKKHLHHNIHSCPSSIDKEHFAAARQHTMDPADQRNIPHPRLGFFGVIDERLDIALVDAIAKERPDWQIIMIGPTVKVDPAQLPRHANIHYLGSKTYQELPAYLAGWDVALLPFAKNEATRFISPTKTPEYLAGGKPVVSTSIEDVVNPYGRNGLVHIADDAAGFINRIEAVLIQQSNSRWLQNVDGYLAGISWDKTWQKIVDEMQKLLGRQKNLSSKKIHEHV